MSEATFSKMNRVHGTRTGYEQHRVMKEKPCYSCRFAYNEYQLKYKDVRVPKVPGGPTAMNSKKKAAEAMRAACIAAVEVSMKANGWDETTIACTVDSLREVQP